jgi:hypothetical protein
MPHTRAGPRLADLAGPTRRRLLAIAEEAALCVGVTSTEWITAVATTHAKALTSAAPGSGPGDIREAVYLITMKGSLTANDAPGPPGEEAPAGAYLSVVLDAGTLRATDWSMSEDPPPAPPSSLGPLTYLKGP